MNKKFGFLGVLIIMAIAICCAFNAPTYSSVFATEIIQQTSSEAGTFYAEGANHILDEETGFYIQGGEVTLRAEMNPGYAFDAWTAKDEEGNPVELQNAGNSRPSDLEYTFTINQNIKIIPTWHKIEYTVSFADDLYNTKPELKDFDYQINNKTQPNGVIYYNNQVEVVISVKEGTYVYDIAERNITVNGVDLYAINNNNPMNVSNVITNVANVTGFSQVVITLDIKEDVVIDIDYIKMYELSLVNGEGFVAIPNVIDFVNIENAYSQPNTAEHKYLVREDRQITITLDKGNNIYEFVSHKLQGNSSYSLAYSTSFSLTSNKNFEINYKAKFYDISFASYVINSEGGLDYIGELLYNIPLIKVNPGNTIKLEYNQDTNAIKLTDNLGAENQYAWSGVYGYKFKSFSVQNGDSLVELTDGEYQSSATEPANEEIKLIFEYIEYTLTITLVDDYFSDDITYVVNDNLNPLDIKLINGDSVSISASTSKYLIEDWAWSWATAPEIEKGNQQIEYVFEFIPTSNELTQCVITLDVRYNYLSTMLTLTSSSIKSEEIEDVTNYTYFADLQVSLIDKISIALNDSKTEGDVTFSGKTFSHNTDTNGIITQFTNPVETLAEGVYKLSYNGHIIEVHMSGDTFADGDYLLFPKNARGTITPVTYYYDGTNFVLRNATINTPSEVAKTSVKEDDQYYIKLDNLLPNAVLIYGANKTSDLYQIKNFRNKEGSEISKFETGAGAHACLVPITRYNEINVEYNELAQQVILNITNEGAYQYSNLTIKINDVAIVDGDKTEVKAIDDDKITISINNNAITEGYKFVGFEFIGNQTNSTELSFTMKVDVHVGQTIDIKFEEIEYIVNIVYLDNDNNQIDDANLIGGKLVLGEQAEISTQTTVVLSGEYIFNAYASVGYYVKDAYILDKDTNKNSLTSLIESNQSGVGFTSWALTSDIFKQYIIDCAVANGDGTYSVDLYIAFAIHTYNIKVYYTMGGYYDSVINYPTININGASYSNDDITREPENNNYVNYILLEGFEYGSSVAVSINDGTYQMGTAFKQWFKDERTVNGRQVNIESITGNINLTLTLQYITYSMKFKSVDTEGNECDYGAGIVSKSFILFDKLENSFTVSTKQGYKFEQMYYLDATGEKGTQDITSAMYQFNPEDFKIEGTSFTIYLVFSLKNINLDITNSLIGGAYYFDGTDVNELATYAVVRLRDGTIEDITESGIYNFQMGDKLTLEITPISSGIKLSSIVMGKTTISELTGGYYKLESFKTYNAEQQIDGYYYRLTVQFEAGVIEDLYNSSDNGNVNLKNNLEVKKYTFKYSYNYVTYKFNITLGIQLADSIFGGGNATDDTAVLKNVGFGSAVVFNYGYDGLATGIGEKFKVKGYLIEGVLQQADGFYTLSDITLWEQIALSKHNAGEIDIKVELILMPKITLQNYVTPYIESQGYIYERAYIGEYQGLKTTGDNKVKDVIIGGGFEISIKYSFDNGVTFSDELPINVGEYPVSIIATISGEATQSIDVEFDEKVTYKIIPAKLTLSLMTYSSQNPITKVYDGNKKLAASLLVPYLGLGGIYQIDINKIKIDSTLLDIEFKNDTVNDMASLYDIFVNNIKLIDITNPNNPIKNYELSSGSNLVFEAVGKIEPKELKILGLQDVKKVNDGTTDVVIDIDRIVIEGKLENDSAEVKTEYLRFYHDAVTSDFSGTVEGRLDWSEALMGADKINYIVTYEKFNIKLHPYQLEYLVNGYGTFKVIDIDKKCLIPIDSKLLVGVYDKGSMLYRELYTVLEPKLSKGEKLQYCYEIILQVDNVNQLLPQGLYISLPKVNKTSKILQVVSDNNVQVLSGLPDDNSTIIKVERGKSAFGLVVKVTYLSLWTIILIVAASLLVVGIVVMTIVIIRRKTKNKYKKYDTI